LNAEYRFTRVAPGSTVTAVTRARQAQARFGRPAALAALATKPAHLSR